jgi:ParB family chromosome partitioning protein
MVSRRGGLGKTGLDSVFSKKDMIVPTKKEDAINQLAIKDLAPNPFQPRKTFDPEQMAELVESIKTSGIVQPLIVRKKDKGYEIVAGERRWRAAKKAGLATVPAIIRKYQDTDMAEIGLIENLQRSDLNPMEEANGYKTMMDELGMTQAEIAKRLGKSRTAVTNALRLLKLPDKIKEYLTNKELTVGQVRPLLAFSDPADMEKMGTIAVEGGLTARIIEANVKTILGGQEGTVFQGAVNWNAPLAENTAKAGEELDVERHKKDKTTGKKEKAQLKKQQKAQKNLYMKEFQEALIEKLSTKVNIQEPKGKSKVGKIVVEYYNEDDLQRLYDLLLGTKNDLLSKKPTKFTGSFHI